MRIDEPADFGYLLPALTMFVLQKWHRAAASDRARETDSCGTAAR